MVRWTKEMDEILLEGFNKVSKREIAESLGIPENSVANRIRQLRLRQNYKARIGKRYFTEEQVRALIEKCRKGSVSKVAREEGIKASCLLMFMRRRMASFLQEKDKPATEGEGERGKRRKRKSWREKKETQAKREAKPLKKRVGIGEFYFVPLERKVGAYKVKETGMAFDKEMFEKGWYFATEEEATLYSYLTQRGGEMEPEGLSGVGFL